MEQLETLLIKYNNSHKESLLYSPWSKQYCIIPFPKYWRVVYRVMNQLDRKSRVLEIGCGQGDVTSIFCYLGFKSIISYERNSNLSQIACKRISDIFGRNDIIVNMTFPDGIHHNADVLVLVNCVYRDMIRSKTEYLQLLKNYYDEAGCPSLYIMEVIDSSYKEDNEEFPSYMRLSENDIKNLFSGFLIESHCTYKYPLNKISKTLYIIRRK